VPGADIVAKSVLPFSKAGTDEFRPGCFKRATGRDSSQGCRDRRESGLLFQSYSLLFGKAGQEFGKAGLRGGDRVCNWEKRVCIFGVRVCFWEKRVCILPMWVCFSEKRVCFFGKRVCFPAIGSAFWRSGFAFGKSGFAFLESGFGIWKSRPAFPKSGLYFRRPGTYRAVSGQLDGKASPLLTGSGPLAGIANRTGPFADHHRGGACGIRLLPIGFVEKASLRIARRFITGLRRGVDKVPQGTTEPILPSLAGLCPSRAIPPSTEVPGYCRMSVPHFGNKPDRRDSASAADQERIPFLAGRCIFEKHECNHGSE